MALRSGLGAHPLALAVVFEGGLIPLALVLAAALGLTPWSELRLSVGVLAGAVLATVPLIASLRAAAVADAAWFTETERLIRPLVEAVFRGRGVAAIVGISLLAGLGEELLFRGVLQASLAHALGDWPGLVLASLVFGLVHALSRAYFLMATAMGLYLGLLYQWTGNLLLPALVHALYDALALAYLLHRLEREAHRS